MKSVREFHWEFWRNSFGNPFRNSFDILFEKSSRDFFWNIFGNSMDMFFNNSIGNSRMNLNKKISPFNEILSGFFLYLVMLLEIWAAMTLGLFLNTARSPPGIFQDLLGLFSGIFRLLLWRSLLAERVYKITFVLMTL